MKEPHKSYFPREARVAWAIAVKDMITYYTRPPSIMFGVLFPFSLFLSFSIGRTVPISAQIPVLIAQTLFFASSSIGPVVIPMERANQTFDRFPNLTSLITLHTPRKDACGRRLRHRNLHHPNTRRSNLLRIPDSQWRSPSRLYDFIVNRFLRIGHNVRLYTWADPGTGDDAPQLRSHTASLHKRRIHARRRIAVLGTGGGIGFTVDSHN